MISLYQNGLNGILADQMVRPPPACAPFWHAHVLRLSLPQGLGKTVQTIGFLSHLRQKGVLGPYLIVGPLSTLPNWVSEFERWCPSFPVLLYHGSRNERAGLRARSLPYGSTVGTDFPVIVTSYEIVMADRKFLQRHHFRC